MDARQWKSKIKKCCRTAGVMQSHYQPVIDALAEILARRDEAAEQFAESGGKLIVEYTNKAGATNSAKNPAYVVWNELNSMALSYWRELCLTPSAYKKACGTVLKLDGETSKLTKALESLDLD